MDTTKTQLLTIEEYVRLYTQEGPFEIIGGERRDRMPPVAFHQITIRALFVILYQHCIKHNLGEVFTEFAFVLTHDSQWVHGSRVPDVMFVAAARWRDYKAAHPDWKQKPLVLVPDLVVEVVSPNDLYTELQDKVAHYLEDGVRQVWVIDPNRARATVYAGEQFAQLTAKDTLDGGDVLPNLKINLGDLFTVEE